MQKFLTADWSDLVMANYEVDPAVLEDLVPSGTELDAHQGRCFVSLVAFEFLNTRVLGVPVPFHTDFLEVNLRFYVTYDAGGELRRGVVFVKEIVPRAAITLVAKTLYGEPYDTWRMSATKSGPELTYEWSKGHVANRLSVVVGKTLGVPEAGSHEAFIIEHYWGYTARGRGQTNEYQVEHPKWGLYELSSSDIDVDFGATFGAPFGFLTGTAPYSLLMANGSPISVYRGKKIRG